MLIPKGTNNFRRIRKVFELEKFELENIFYKSFSSGYIRVRGECNANHQIKFPPNLKKIVTAKLNPRLS